MSKNVSTLNPGQRPSCTQGHWKWIRWSIESYISVL